jgi:hypothetical protein
MDCSDQIIIITTIIITIIIKGEGIERCKTTWWGKWIIKYMKCI